MKAITIFTAILFSFFTINSASAQAKKTESIKVWGNCGQCKKNIEKAAKKAGATSATWSISTKMLAMTYPTAKTNSLKIQQAIGKAGYDTQDVTADDKAYNSLDGCCQYDRKPAVKGPNPTH